MNILKPLAVVAIVLVLQACKHPLAIVGEGDIIDANNSGHGCTLEQFQAGDAACTENEVTGDYDVNYRADPRPGWRFVRWEGPCAQVSHFQYCRIESEADWVAWTDENYPDYEFPASTAVFELIAGETGYLLGPGGAVAGVAYKTPTLQGVTDLEGSFQYAEGEVVQFMVGATVLGEVVGRREVTPFTLAGSPAHTGIQITWALQDRNNPFHTVVNLAVFLQSLDHDGDAINGIEIKPGIAALLPDSPIDFRSEGYSVGFEQALGPGLALGLRMVDVRPGECALGYCYDNEWRQPWETFQKDVVFRHLLGRVRSRRLFSIDHGVVKPATALDGLYRALGIDPQPVALTVRSTEHEEGNSPKELWEYDAEGYVIRHSGVYDGFENWQYNTQGDVTHHEEHSSLWGYHRIEDWRYDPDGNLEEFVRDYEGDLGNPGRYEIKTFLYDNDGNPIGQSFGLKQAGHDFDESRGKFAYTYDSRGNLRHYSEEETFGGDRPANPERWEFDITGNVTRYEHDNEVDTFYYSANGKLIRRVGSDVLESYEYDAKGNLVRHLTDGEVVETWQYDADGRLVQYEGDLCIQGCHHYKETWEYDQSGNLVRYENGGSVETWRYDANGHAVFRQRASVEDGTIALTEFWEYRPNGAVRLHRLEDTSGDLGEDGVWYSFVTSMQRQYDSNSNLIREEIDMDGDGRPDRIDTWEYDAAGKLTRRETDESGNGTIERAEIYQYEAAGWGHLFSGIKTFGDEYSPPLKPGLNP